MQLCDIIPKKILNLDRNWCENTLLHRGKWEFNRSRGQVAGWVSSRRDHGGVIFIDLRDKDEVVQLVCDPQIALRLTKFGLIEGLGRNPIIGF